MVDTLVDYPLGNSEHSSISFFVKIPNITFSPKVYLKSRGDWPHVCEDL